MGQQKNATQTTACLIARFESDCLDPEKCFQDLGAGLVMEQTAFLC